MNKGDGMTVGSLGRVLLDGRKTLSLTGVASIVSFDESIVTLDCEDSLLTVEGDGLQILKMDVSSGEIEIVGRVNALIYSDKRQGVKGLGGLFRGAKRQ